MTTTALPIPFLSVHSGVQMVLAGAWAVLVTSICPVHAEDWPQFLGPNRNGTCTSDALAKSWPKEGPPIVWKREVGAGFTGPVVAGGRLIVFHRVKDEETVECLDAKTGAVRWKKSYPTGYRDQFNFDPGPRATPAISGKDLITFGAEGMLNCWDIETGAKRWGIDTRARFATRSGFFGSACSPVVDGTRVIINVGGRNGAGIVALDKETGKLLWKATDDEASYASPVVASVNGTRRGFVLTREALVALNSEDGTVLFRYPFRPSMSASVTAATPLVIGDRIFISASYSTGATLLRFKTGAPEKIWHAKDALSNHYATSVHHAGFLYGFDGRQEHGCDLRCIDLKSGDVRWSQSGLKAGTVTLVNDQILVMTERGELIRVRAAPEKFEVIARAQILGFGVRAHPAFADGLFYARSPGTFVCVDLR